MVWTITSPEAVQNENALYIFKKTVDVQNVAQSTICLYADARYKLYINGRLVAVGPCRRSCEIGYYDKVDITPYIRSGKNDLEVRVLQLATKADSDSWLLLEGIMRNGRLGLGVWGNVGDTVLNTDESWVCAKEKNVRLGFERTYPNYNAVQVNEYTTAAYGKELDFVQAVYAEKHLELDVGENDDLTVFNPIIERPIPMMYFEEKAFVSEADGLYDAGYETCGYVRVHAKGTGSIKLTYAESKVVLEDGKIYRRQRDAAGGIVLGDCDRLAVDGTLAFETYWMRTFRYIQMEITGNVQIEKMDYLETGYPLAIYDDYDFGDVTDNRVFDVSVNTLRRCMHETYVDCPYYEQLQYAMDTYQQMLFTYQLTSDCALPEKAIDDFAKSYRVGGLTQSRFPTNTMQYIPGFSLLFISMLYSHACRFGNKKFIRKYLHIADGILHWFEERLDGYMVARSNLWDFIDWSEEYLEGVIPENAPMALYSMMYADALEKTAEMHDMLGRVVSEYAELAAKIKTDVKNRCYDAETGLYADTPLKGHFSQHPQIWAVLCGMESAEAAKQLLAKSEELSCKATIAYAYYRLRAYEKAGMYESAQQVLDIFRALIPLGCTTMPECEFDTVRSECHAWSAVGIYEFTAKVLGVTYENGQIHIAPYIGKRLYAKGTVATPVGGVFVSWENKNGDFSIEVKLPVEQSAHVVMPDGSTLMVRDGVYSVKL